ncbi:MAG: hypothetical protein KGH64_00635 [Candidatus Micrarchaeota archaeon]|nr:hypothetical protein [Candidatus Micrarchaeota archaeon]
MIEQKATENPYLLWMRNVRDEMKSLPDEEIKAILRNKSLPFSILMCVHSDFNFGTLIRNANNFAARKVFYFGEHKRYNRRSALGTYKYTDVTYLPTMEDLIPLKSRYVFVGVENCGKTVPLKSFDWPKEPILMLFGEESSGLQSNVIELLDYCVEIPSLGSVRSLNVGSASAIVMYDYVSKRGK